MTRLRLLLVLLFMLGVSTPHAALAHGEEPVRTETVQAGPYTLTVLYYTPPISQQPLTLVLVSEHPLTVTAEVLPLSDPEAVPEPLAIQPDLEHGATAVALGWTPELGGEWELALHVEGAEGPASARLEIEVAPPVVVPHWLAWLVGLSPLYGLAWFFAREFRRVRQVDWQPAGAKV